MVMKRLALAIAAAAVGFAALWGSPVFAHNTLVEAAPAKDAALTEPPAEVRLRFLAELKPDTKLTVTDAQGASAIGEATIDGKSISAPFTGTAGGRYTVAYELMSADGHPVKSSYSFTLQLAQAPVVAESSAPPPPPSSAPPAAAPEHKAESTPWFPYIGGAAAAGLVVGGIIAFLRRKRGESG
ncbi:copper resistance CopC family protein [Allorhizocola rhizosphaerae]|uniref:copper resistance CopC family protein n=1 Tax=Allorhizocola rhizosphaerae TaxID=1872709 RepID=UPI000E3BF8E1|nr:copper resistance CopC family protein [Allorhizocola rhizosphaerae]